MHSSHFFQQYIKKEFQQQDFHLEPYELYDPIAYTLSLGGKRLRPVLLLMSCELFGGDLKSAINQAIAIELFHNFTLLHDDIMDNSSTRRNQPTVHEKWNVNTAILSGDVMLIKSYQYLVNCDTMHLPKIIDVFNQIAVDVCEGQQWDMVFEQKMNVSIEEYIKMISLKTASLIAGSLTIGAILGNAKEQDINYLFDFGKNLGIAFQLQDDYLDSFGNSETFGKKIGSDILNNKKTFLLVKALELADEEIKKELISIITLKTFDDQWKIDKVKKLYEQLNIQVIAEKEINYYFTKALHFLERMNSNPDGKFELVSFLTQLMKRDI